MEQISFSGTHGTGKSTSAAFEYRSLKLLHPDKSVCLLCDMEAYCPFEINKGTSERAQSWMFARQIKHEIESSVRFDYIITDRTIVDIIAYTYVAGFDRLASGMLDYAHHYVKAYDEIRVKQLQFNSFLYEDGIRDIDPSFRADVESVLNDLYAQLQSSGAIHGNLYFV